MMLSKSRKLQLRGKGFKDLAGDEMTDEEKAQLKETFPWLPPNIARYAVWRSARIQLALAPFMLYLVSVFCTCVGLKATAGEVVTSLFEDQFTRYFVELHVMCKVERYAVFVGAVIAWWFGYSSIGGWNGVRFDLASVYAVRMCVALNIGVPFVLVLFMPFRHGLDVLPFRKSMCRHVAETMANHTEHFLAGDIIAQTLMEDTFDVHDMRRTLCTSSPIGWGKRFIDFVASGPLFTVRESCNDFERNYRLLADGYTDVDGFNNLLACASLCKPALSCDSRCTMFLASPAMTSAGGQLDYARLGAAASGCHTCFEETLALGCIQQCHESRRLQHTSRICVTHLELKELELVADLSSQVVAEKLALGLFFGVKAFMTLFPLSLSIANGIIHGGDNAHAVLPQSRFPAFISLTVSFTSLPFIVVILACLQTIVGNVWTAVGTSVYVINHILSTRFWHAMEVDEHHKHMLDSPLLIWSVRLAMTVAFIVGIFINREAWIASEILGHFILQEPYSLVSVLFRTFVNYMGWGLINLVLVLFGQSLILSVFFADTFVELTYHFQSLEAHQGDEDRYALWTQCESLRNILDPENDESMPQVEICKPSGRSWLSWFLCLPDHNHNHNEHEYEEVNAWRPAWVEEDALHHNAIPAPS